MGIFEENVLLFTPQAVETYGKVGKREIIPKITLDSFKAGIFEENVLLFTPQAVETYGKVGKREIVPKITP